jgi:autotransporter-associated beta strand protein
MNKTLLSGLIGLLMPLGGYASMAGRHYAAAPAPQWEPASLLDLQTKTANRQMASDSSPQLVQGQQIRELVIIDAAVPDKTTLYKSLKPGVDVVELNSQQDGMLQLQQVLQHYSGLQAVHLVSHAEQGKILLGNSSISSSLLAEHAGLLRQLNQSVVTGGDLLLYGCDLAAGAQGQELLELFSSATHLDVAASSNKTGAAELGGDWDLEIQQGDIQSTLAFSPKALADFSGVLAPEVYTASSFPQNSYQPSITSSDNDLQVTGSADVYAGAFSDRIYLPINVAGGMPSGHLQLAAANTLVSFELTGLNVKPNPGGAPDVSCSQQAVVTGYTSSASQIVGTFDILNSDTTINVNLSAFSGEQITRFKVSASGCNSVYHSLQIQNFTVDNKKRNGDDTTAPAFENSTPSASSITQSGFDLNVDINEAGHLYYVVVANGAAAPTGAQIKAGQNSSGAAAILSGNQQVNTGQFSHTFNVTGLNSGTDYDVYLVVEDDEAVPNRRTIKLDAATASPPPTVTAVTASTADGAYNAGDVISIQVNFSANVTVTGTPQLTLETGATDRVVNYSSGSGSSSLTFNYTVQAGDTSSDLDYLSTNALALNSGTIKNGSAVDAVLTLATPGAANSLGANKALVIDTTAPTIATSSDKATLKAGETATLTFSLSEASNSFTDADISVSGGTLSGFSGSGASYTATLTPSADSTASANIDVPAGGFTDAAGNTNTAATQLSLTVNTVVPTISSINRVSAANSNASSVDYSVSFSESVTGVDTSDFTLTATGSASGAISNVTPVSGSVYTVTVNSITGDGTLRLDLKASGTGITNAAGNAIASGYTSGQIYTFDHTVPAVTFVSVPASSSYIAGAQLNFTVNFSEAVTLDTTGGTPRIAITMGSSTVYASYVSGSGSSALTFRYTVQSGDLDADGVALASAIDLNGGTIRDSVGNNANTTLNSVGSTAGVVVDAVAPAAPSAPDLTSGSDTGSSTSDDITGDETPTFTGTAEAGSTVTLYDTNGTTALGSATTNGSGNWTITSSVLTAGSHTVTAKAADAAGNVSFASADLTITIDLSLAPLEVTTNSDSGDDATIGASLSADTADGGGLSLREALHYVANNGIITFYHCLDGQTIALSSAATVKSGVTLDTSAVDNLTISGSQLNPAGAWAITNGAGGQLTLASVVSGSAGLTKTGAGTLVLSGTNTYSGVTTVSAGTLSVASDANLGAASLSLSAGAVLNLTGVTTVDNAISLAGAASINTDANVTLSGALSGSSTLTKTGSATLTLSNTSNATGMSGGVTVTAGTLSLTAKTSMPTGTLTLNGGSLSATTSIDLDNNILIGSSGATIAGASLVELKGVISGTGNLTKTSTQNLFLYGNNSFSGDLIVNSGFVAAFNHINGFGSGVIRLADSTTLAFASVGTATLANTIVLSGNASLVVGNTGNDNVTIGGVISETGGSRNLSLNSGTASTSSLSLAAANSYTGTTTISQGVINITDATNISAGNLILNGTDASLRISGSNVTFANNISLSNNASIRTNNAVTLSGVVSGSSNLTKSGTGVLTLSGTNTYTGTTTVSAGTLAVTGSTTSVTTVASGGTLAGNGTLSQAVTVQSGGTLAPAGSGVGQLTLGNGLTLQSGSTLALDIAGSVAGTGYDRVNVTGAVNVTAATLALNHSYAAADGDSYTVIVNDSNDAISGTFSGVAEGATVTATGNSSSLSVSYLGDTGNDISLSFLAVPGAPTAVTATAGNASASVAFTVPSVTGSSAITGYTVTSTPGNLTATGTSSPIQITGLTNGTSYTFTVRATNSAGQGAASASSNAVTPVAPVTNTAPVISGSPDTTVARGSSYSFTPSAFDADGQALTFSISTLPGWASFSSSTGALTGTPAATDVGTTSGIVISVSDGTATASLPAFSITVEGSNVAPVAADGAATTAEDTPVSLSLTAQDADQNQLSYEIVSAPAHGSVTLQGSTVVYTPERNYHGTDSLSFIAKDAELSSSTASISLTVTPVNDAPVAVDDSFTQERVTSEQYALAVLANDTDVDGDLLRIDGASTTVGSVSFSADSLSLTVPALYVGPVTLRYSVTDGKGGRGTATVGLLIEGGNAANLPVITVPADIVVNATGLSTRVALGTATAVDRNGNRLSVSLIRGEPLFEPGEHTVYWQATDATGNTATKAQKVSVRPLVSLSKDQVVTEGSDVSVDIILNGPSPVYPLLVPYSVSGSADGTDHTLTSGVAEISSGVGTSISFTVLEDGQADPQEDIVISLGAVNQGSKNSTRIEVSDQNIAPVVALGVTQSGENRLTVAQNGGAVTISAAFSDANTADVLTGNWTLGGLTNASAEQTQLSFDPAEQGPGLYQVSYTVTDNGSPALSATSSVFVVVQASLPTLGTIDSDGDLIPDNEEGFADSDGDGIPDYQDAISECNVMPTELLGQTQFLAEGDPGVCLRLGTVAAQTNAGGLQIKQESIQVDPVAVYIGGIFDFIAYGLPEQGQSYSLAIPQRAPVPANAGYRKYSDATGWVAFVRNEKNSVSSSPGESGYCPPPGDASWTPGLTEGHWCVQVTVEDGGPNDADGVANGAIVDPGGVAVALSSNRLPVAVADTAKTQENTAVVVNVLANDTDADGDSLRISQAVANFGAVTILDNQSLSYMPTTDFKGIDKVVYSITDGKGGTASAELLVDVSGNTAPVAADDVASTDDKTAVLIAVLANDRDADGHSLTVSAASAQQGTVRIEADQRLRYTPKAGFNGVDIISYRVTDSQGGEASAQVRVTVTALKDVVVDNKSGGGSMTLWMVLALAGAVVLRRRSVVGLAAVVLLWFSPVSQAEQWYLQGSVGHSKADQQQSRLVEELPNGTITAFDDNDSSYGLALGYQLHPHVALELGYQDLGEAGSEISGESLTPAQYHDLVKAVSPVLVDGYTAAVRLSLWQNDLLNLEVPLGLFFWDSKIESQMGDTVLRSEMDGNDWFLGVQLNYKLAQDWQLGLGYQQLNLEPNDVNSWQLSVRFSF